MALVGAFSVITNLRMELFQALDCSDHMSRCVGVLENANVAPRDPGNQSASKFTFTYKINPVPLIHLINFDMWLNFLTYLLLHHFHSTLHTLDMKDNNYKIYLYINIFIYMTAPHHMVVC